MTKEKIYVFGHLKPDTDSVTSAISVAYLKRQLGYNASAYILGDLNKESEFVLKYFNIKTPSYLDNVKLQIKDVEYYKGYYVNDNDTVIDTYNYFKEKGITGAPVVDLNKRIKGVITSKDIVSKIIEDDSEYLSTSYGNLVKTIDGVEVLKFDDEITGKILVPTVTSKALVQEDKLKSDTILIVGLRNNVINYAINVHVKAIIIVSGNELSIEQIEKCKTNKINVIKTNLESLKTARRVINSEYIKNVMNNDIFYKFNQNYYFYDFLKEARKLGHNNYPVVDKNDDCLGLIRVTDKNIKHNKKVILVDHNESEQSVEGLEEAEIIEVVDHHKLGDLSTNDPINFRNMAVGSTNTIVFQMFKERQISIPYNIAGLMLSGILSDTLCLTSSTTTDLDRYTVNILSTHMNLDYEAYYKEMLTAGTSIDGLTKLEVLTQDYKNFQVEDKKYAVGQTITLDIDNIMKDKDEYLSIMEERCNNQNFEFILFIITDVIKNGSYILYTKGCEEMLKDSFELNDVYEGVFISGLTSRKKQVIPYINDYIK